MSARFAIQLGVVLAIGFFVLVASLLGAAGPAFAVEPAAASPTASTRGLLDWYAMGGGLMHGLAVCSVLIVATILERVFVLRSSVTLPRRRKAEIERALAVGNFSELKPLCEGASSSLLRLASRAIDPAASAETIESVGSFEAHRLLRNLPLLSALGNLATMIGLLGTVLGMLDAFDRIAAVGSGDARVVAGGIFLALITTAAGLSVATVAVGAHAWLSRRAEDIVAELERLAGRIRDSVELGQRGGQLAFGRADEQEI